MAQAVKGIEKASKGISNDILRVTAHVTADYARQLYQGAEYDGDISDIEVRVKERKNGGYTVAAKGEAVPFIEYGAGEKYGGKTEYWFFTIDPGTVFRTKDGGHAHYRKLTSKAKELKAEGLDKEDTARYELQGRTYTRAELYEHLGKGSFASSFGTTPGIFANAWEQNKRLSSGERFQDKYNRWFNEVLMKNLKKTDDGKKPDTAKQYKWEEKTDSGFTRGNPPQHIMEQALEEGVGFLKRKYKAK